MFNLFNLFFNMNDDSSRSKLRSFLEHSEANDNIGIKSRQMRNEVEDTLNIHGYVTVVKNQGKENEEVLCKDKHNLLTTDGIDIFHKAIYVDTVATEVGNNFLALSVNTHTPVVGDTTLLGEITTGGLARALATTITHTNDTNVTTLAHTFTASATHTAVQLAGIFNQLTIGGTLTHENTFTPANLVSGDTLTVTWTLTLG